MKIVHDWSIPAGKLSTLLLSCALVACAGTQPGAPAGHAIAKAEATGSLADSPLAPRLALQHNNRAGKNVILFVGDGMGVPTVTAARIFAGQRLGGSGEDHDLPFDTFPHVALIKTYNTNQQVSDSAGTATAMHAGQKTRAGVIGVGPSAQRRNCEQSQDARLESILEQAERAGKQTGIVTTTRLTHATPATAYAHSPERDWEDDRFISPEAVAQGCRDIATQLVEFSVGDGIEVMLGGGRGQFFGADRKGKRTVADADLVSQWQQRGSRRRYVETADQLNAVHPGEQVLGLFANSHLQWEAERTPGSQQPTLAQMTSKAIEMLEGSDQGYYLLIEGGRIDHGHHEGMAGYALMEAEAFAAAINAALARVDLNETLVLVTADHSHTLTISGYPTRGNPILGRVQGNNVQGEPTGADTLDANGVPYTTLGYINGPGAVTTSPRPAPDTGKISAKQQALVPTHSFDISGAQYTSETHGGDDVALYAIGPRAHLVGGTLEQHAIYYVMANAFGWFD